MLELSHYIPPAYPFIRSIADAFRSIILRPSPLPPSLLPFIHGLFLEEIRASRIFSLHEIVTAVRTACRRRRRVI